ncbi:hypothetical protein CA54_42630 [Symmachiella macrocystis]|uniref:DUF3891 family protein n=1 Tax=Symmachiella macrocystis TaxID=2527985 RepID=A0A5C6BAB0_9PLAN|nr:DUF3891 family protein [Symmachiella macrocystis]TWU09023.1 hypothetical protein CA54_42630 [Symmachiella macrocystis]
MIRREQGADWLIVSQVDHARLAAELAQVWRHSIASSWGISELLFHAVLKHDDGWRAWETGLEIDPANGIPRDFTEMPMDVASGIWTSSIETCATEHPLAGIWVSRHFCYLAQHSLSSRADNAADVSAARRFLAEQEQSQQQLRSVSLQDVTAREFANLSELGVRFLRLFDGLSLWLCCAERSETSEIQCDGQSARFIPYADARIVIDPYVLTKQPLTLAVPARRIAARAYADNKDLRAAIDASPVEELSWTFTAHDLS